MGKRISLAAAILVLCMVAPISAVHAENLDVRPYVGAGVGFFGLEYKDTAISQSKTGFGGLAKLGWDLSDYFGFEFRLGTTSKVSKSYTAGSGLGGVGTFRTGPAYFASYLGKLQIPVGDDFLPYVMFGGTTGVLKITNSRNGGSASVTRSGPSYGVGVDYYVADKWTINGEWMQYWTDVKLGDGLSPAPGTGSKARLWGAVAAMVYHY